VPCLAISAHPEDFTYLRVKMSWCGGQLQHARFYSCGQYWSANECSIGNTRNQYTPRKKAAGISGVQTLVNPTT
jgi:hypothetical protein